MGSGQRLKFSEEAAHTEPSMTTMRGPLYLLQRLVGRMAR